MTIEINGDEVIIKISSKVNLDDIKKSLDYIRYIEISSKSKANEADVEQLAHKINTNWWQKNRNIYLSKKGDVRE